MVSPQDNERLIDELVARLDPVRRVPRPEIALCAVVGAWLVGLGCMGAAHGLSPALAGTGAATGGFVGVLVGLGLCALGGSAAGLAAAIPGREASVRIGRSLGGLGLVVAIAAASLGLVLATGSTASAPFSASAKCFAIAVGLAVLPGSVLGLCVLRGWVGRPLSATRLVLAGAFGLGGLGVHLLCPLVDPAHVLAGHVSVPLVTAALGAWPGAELLRRYAR